MDKIFTYFRFGKSYNNPKEWKESCKINNSNLSSDIVYQNRPHKDLNASEIYLQWANEREIVSLPNNFFYINYGKRILDITISIFVIVSILTWLVPIVGILIVIDSPGPFVFIQYRSGLKGRQFPCLKFRTMYCSAPIGKFQQTMRDDIRVTALGRFLRRTNLDEMLQFLNVFLGHMSIVGPRPHAVSHDAEHWNSPAYRERYWVKPGITGLAQIRGARGATTHEKKMEHRVRYDHFYIPRQTFLLDIKICFLTLRTMFKGDKNAW